MSQITFETMGNNGVAYTKPELMTTIISHLLEDGQLVGTGAASALARAACRMAQLTHAPNLTYVAGGGGAVNSELDPLVPSSGDYTNLICESALPMSTVVETALGGKLDVFIASGLQIDKYGNVNLSVIGDGSRPSLRGPGGALLPMFARAKSIIYFFFDHSPRTFVEKVDLRTAPGFLDGAESWHKAKADGLYYGNGPAWVITSLAMLDFDPETKAMRLRALHPGVTLEQVKKATGFDLIIPPSGAISSAPTPSELELLRSIDTQGVLR